MKRFNFLPVAIALVLMVTAVSCTTMSGTQDDYYHDGQGTAQVYGNRVYVDDPYRGRIVLERDPWSGRYYEVSPYGTYNNRSYGSRTYGRSGYGSPSYRRNNSGYYPRGNQQNPQPQPSPQERKESKDEARKKVLGN